MASGLPATGGPLVFLQGRRLIVVRKGAVAALVVTGLVVGGCGDKKQADTTPKLTGTLTFGVLAPVQRQGDLGTRAKDLMDGANLAVKELNGSGGVLGKKVALSVVDDACDP